MPGTPSAGHSGIHQPVSPAAAPVAVTAKHTTASTVPAYVARALARLTQEWLISAFEPASGGVSGGRRRPAGGAQAARRRWIAHSTASGTA